MIFAGIKGLLLNLYVNQGIYYFVFKLKKITNWQTFLTWIFLPNGRTTGSLDVILCLLYFYRENKYCTAFWDNQINCASYRLHTNQFCLVLTFCNTRSFISILNVLNENVGSILYVICCHSGQYTRLTLWYITITKINGAIT